MSMDHTTDQSESMFVATPVWERSGKKRRSLTASKTLSRPAVVTTAEPGAFEASPDEPAPTVRRTTVKKQNPAGMASAIALGAIVVAGAGAAGWYALQDRDTGVAQLTPGETGPVEVAANTAVPPPTVAPVPASATERAVTRTAAARVRPAVATAATGASVDTSATLPEGPVPYAQPNPDAARAAPNPAAPAEPVRITPPAAVNPAEPAAPVPAEPPMVTPPQ